MNNEVFIPSYGRIKIDDSQTVRSEYESTISIPNQKKCTADYIAGLSKEIFTTILDADSKEQVIDFEYECKVDSMTLI
jgi:hypothetical protein